jgi:Cu+-exporting ATPase
MRIIITAALTLALAASACASAPNASPSASPTAPTTQDASLKAPGEAKVGDKTKCPVSGEEFTVTASSPHADYNGKTYYFCCADCPSEFTKDPQKYLKGATST